MSPSTLKPASPPKLRPHLLQASLTSLQTGLLFGYSVGFIGGLLILPSFLSHFHLLEYAPATQAKLQSLIVSSWIVGAFFGVFVIGMPVSRRFGRKGGLVAAAGLYLLGAVLELVEVEGGLGLGVFVLGRFLNGLGVGAGTLVSPM
jgi:MFS family permease